MFPHKHFIFGLIFTFILLLISPLIGLTGFLLIILSTILLDIDHYIYYIFKKRDFNLIKAYIWFKNKRKKTMSLSPSKRKEFYVSLLFFHGLEIPIIFFLLTLFVSEIFGFIFVGIILHLMLDYIEQWRIFKEINKLSVIYDFLNYRKLKYLE